MITEPTALSIAKKALKEWDGEPADLELLVRRLDHGWRFEIPRPPGEVIGRSHPGVTTTGQVVRIPDGIPDEVANDILAARAQRPHA
ncbi:MAG: hypothetical protein ACRDYY_10750 [Acidimicrobiales bacterium]